MKTGRLATCFFTGAGTQLRALLGLILCAGLNAYGQQITGTIAGTVRDAQGAVVTNATIKATNVDTGLARPAATTADGTYSIQYLPVGTYTVEVDASGFKRFVQKNVLLTLDQIQTLNVILEVGVQNQTVTVTEAPPLVDTSTAELGRTVQSSEIIGLPLVNRNAYAELSLTPGVQANSASPSSNPSGTPNFVIGLPSTQVVVNGGIDGGNPMVSFYLDGGINMTGFRNYGNPYPTRTLCRSFAWKPATFRLNMAGCRARWSRRSQSREPTRSMAPCLSSTETQISTTPRGIRSSIRLTTATSLAVSSAAR